MGVKPLGRHLLLELFECDATALSSLPTVKTSMLEAANRAHATIVNHVFHEFRPFGVSGEVLQPQLAAEYLAERFTAGRISVVELGRGLLNHEVVEESRPALAATPEKTGGA